MAADPPHPGAGRLVAVVVTHDRPAQLRITLSALLAASPDELAALLVVDNASGPATRELLAGVTDSRLNILTLHENTGGAGGFAAGMRHALEALAPDWLVLMDDDARPEPGTLEAFHRLDLEAWDAVAGAARHPDGTVCEMNRPTLDPFRRREVLLRALAGRGREAFHLSERHYAAEGFAPVDGSSFVGLFLSRRAVERNGFPDTRLFLYADDAIYTQGMTRAGFRLAFAPSLRFEHDSSTYSREDPRMRPMWKVYYYHRNLIVLYREVAGAFFLPVMMLYIPRWAMRAWHHPGERLAWLRLYLRAVRDGLSQRLDISHDEVLAMARTQADTTVPRPKRLSRRPRG